MKYSVTVNVEAHRYRIEDNSTWGGQGQGAIRTIRSTTEGLRIRVLQHSDTLIHGQRKDDYQQALNASRYLQVATHSVQMDIAHRHLQIARSDRRSLASSSLCMR